MGRIYAIAINTFREAVRDRVLYGVLGLGCGVLLFSLALAELSLNQQERVVQDIGLASISLFAVLVAIFLGSSLLYKEIERKTLYVVLPKPIRRVEFLLGKYAGICLTVAVFVALMGALELWVYALQLGLAPLEALGALGLLGAALAALFRWSGDRTGALVPWAALCLAAGAALVLRVDGSLEPALAQLSLVLGEVAILAAVAVFFSSFSTPFLTGAFTLGVWVVGRSADDMEAIQAHQVGEALTTLLHGAARVLPNLNLFVPGRTILAEAPWGYVAQTLGYGALYAVVALAIAGHVFQRRDFL